MGGAAPAATGPDWNRLYEIAAGQEGHFTTAQAAEAGYCPQLLLKYLRNGRITRVRRGIYRLVHFPAGEHEDLVAVWLWTNRTGVFSHETALALHGLSDVMSAKVHLTLPESWSRRRLRVPKGVVLHFADVARADGAWAGSIPVTGPARTLQDCAVAAVPPETMRKAIRDAVARGLVTRSELAAVRHATGRASRPRKTGINLQV
jgi:predicted transcriptional regulator of viral defense system